MDLADVTASEAQDFHPTTYEDRYRVMYHNVLVTVVTSIKDWFNESCFVVYKNIESLNSKKSKVKTLLMSQTT